MIKLVVGKKGSGKTKRMVEMANEAVKKTKGHVVFIDYDTSRMFQIDYRARFMHLNEYNIANENEFLGFLCGVVASNYDIDHIFIDGLMQISETELENMDHFFDRLDKLEKKFNITFVIGISWEDEIIPEYLGRYRMDKL
ncbi:hypothetical protein SAMN05192551_101571 [Tindallia magadiensis]|uniref:Uncharacterized protein n=1 Tax=Tindallia magadiensis TaxID=69895 RepID=A0A1I3B5M9_9FIRM|nr:hypothetical protein [Tindallia magadiensis]SFH57011.1 hypothetical protein SAMN05192551_101571 [Tindallia magadiensis]